MYIEPTVSGYVGTEQVTRRARFLILMQERGDSSKGLIRGIIRRRVALHQCGHWMMGRARIGAEWYTLSGACGHDGLTLDVAPDAFNRGTVLPDDLRAAWNTGGGWNSAGSEADAMRTWAQTI